MIYRQLIEELQRWSEKENRKPLVLRGARQVGKTTLVDEFGIDEVVSPTGHPFRLINFPFYYVGVLDKVLEKSYTS